MFTVNHLKLIHSIKPNCCGFSQLCTNTIGSINFRGDCSHPLEYNVIIMEFTVVMIPRLLLIFHLHNITIQRRFSTVILIQTYHVFCQKHEACTVFHWEKNDTAMKNIVMRNDVFHTQQLEQSFQDFQKIHVVWNIW